MPNLVEIQNTFVSIPSKVFFFHHLRMQHLCTFVIHRLWIDTSIYPMRCLLPSKVVAIAYASNSHNHMVEILYGCSIGSKSPYKTEPMRNIKYLH